MVDFGDECRQVLHAVGIAPPDLPTYPVPLQPFLGQQIWTSTINPRVIEAAVRAWDTQPRGWALDVGVDAHGRTLVVEANDGLALGAYGLPPRDYARLLSARWTELTGTADACNF